MDTMLLQSPDLMLHVMLAQLPETLLLVIMLPMLLAVNQDSMLSMDLVKLAHLMLNHVMEESLQDVTLDSS
jgi:hypothetical protein